MNPKKVKLLNVMFMTCQIYNRSRLKHIQGIKRKEGEQIILPTFLTVLHKEQEESLVKNL